MNNERNNSLIFTLLPAIIGTVVAEAMLLYDLGGITMNGDGNIALTVAIISAAVSLIGILITLVRDMKQSKRDAKGIKDRAGEIKEDTAHMRPLVDNISSDTATIKDDLIRSVLPAVKTTDEIATGVQKLVDEQNYKRQLRQDNTVVSRDIFLNEAEKLYDVNARLAAQHIKDTERITELEHENAVLTQRVSELTKSQTQSFRHQNMER